MGFFYGAWELAHQAGMKHPRIFEADWDYRLSNPLLGPPRERGKTAPAFIADFGSVLNDLKKIIILGL